MCVSKRAKCHLIIQPLVSSLSPSVHPFTALYVSPLGMGRPSRSASPGVIERAETGDRVCEEQRGRQRDDHKASETEAEVKELQVIPE